MDEARPQEEWDVVVVGGGPSGLAAATRLRELGVGRVLVLEREREAGGIPRHCGHPPFGMREFGRVLTGPAYARRLVRRALAAGVQIRTGADVVRIAPGGGLDITDAQGMARLHGRRVLLATGTRETPRSARLIGGRRPLGVFSTGALQSFVYLGNRVPFHRPVIVGTELVSFSALLTCWRAGVRPVAMIEENDRPTAWRLSALLPRVLGVLLHYGSRIVRIEGAARVESVEVETPQGRRHIACDGVLFTGCFTSEATLARMGHLEMDPASSGPVVDQFGRCSDPVYYATGNLLRPVETAGWCWREGCDQAAVVAEDLNGRLPSRTSTVIVKVAAPVKYAVPQRIAFPLAEGGMRHIQLRWERAASGRLEVTDPAGAVFGRRMSALPERRVLLPLDRLLRGGSRQEIDIRFQETGKRDSGSWVSARETEQLKKG